MVNPSQSEVDMFSPVQIRVAFDPVTQCAASWTLSFDFWTKAFSMYFEGLSEVSTNAQALFTHKV